MGLRSGDFFVKRKHNFLFLDQPGSYQLLKGDPAPRPLIPTFDPAPLTPTVECEY